jgi:Membrane domain of glycerophosphoryl diester phosphodiesterase
MTEPPAGGPGVPPWSSPGEEPPASGGGWGSVPPPSWGAPPPAWVPVPRPATGVVPLRPLSVGEILDGAFQAVRSNARTMVGTSAVVLAAVTVLSLVPQALVLHGLAGNPAFSNTGVATLQDLFDAGIGLLEARSVPLLLTYVATVALDAMLVVPVAEAVLGRRISAGEMWRRARGRLLAALGLSLLVGLALVALALAMLVPGVVAAIAGARDLAVVLLLAGTAGGLLLAVLVGLRWSLAAPVLVLERAPVTTALRRSWRLVNGSAWRVFGVLLLAAIITYIGQVIIAVPTGVLAGLPAQGQSSQYGSLPATFAQLLISGIGTIAGGAVFYPFNAAVTALLYIDLRMRREGLDVRLAQSAAEPGPPR